MDDLIATLVLAREKAEAMDLEVLADKLSTELVRLRRQQRVAEKEAEKTAKRK